MRTVNPSNAYRGLTFPQWKTLLELASTLSAVAYYLDDPVLLFRANTLLLKVQARYYD